MNKYCVIIPTYNNANTIVKVVESVYEYCKDIIVVMDGCTDATGEYINSCHCPFVLVAYEKNMGKGHALVKGFEEASKRGFTHAITIDADGQHFPDDIPSIVEKSEENPEAFIVGNRNLNEKNMPRGNTFANKFSNFWFRLQTGVDLGDTQSGFRLYPLSRLHGLRHLTSRYEAELELLVYASWRGEEIISVPVKVYYPPAEERVSHFRPFWDFMRISLLNCVLCVGALFYKNKKVNK